MRGRGPGARASWFLLLLFSCSSRCSGAARATRAGVRRVCTRTPAEAREVDAVRLVESDSLALEHAPLKELDASIPGTRVAPLRRASKEHWAANRFCRPARTDPA